MNLLLGLIITILIAAVVIWIVSKLNLGLSVDGYGSAIIAAIVIAIVNAIVFWLLGLLGITVVGFLSLVVLLIIAAIAIAVVYWLLAWLLALLGLEILF